MTIAVMNRKSHFEEITLVAAVRFTANHSFSGPICEFTDAGNNHPSQTALRQLSPRDVDPRIGLRDAVAGKLGLIHGQHPRLVTSRMVVLHLIST